MTKKAKIVISVIIVVLIILLDIFYLVKFYNPRNENKIEPEITTIANPASTYCIEQGGNLVIEDKDDGSQYGLCFFEDNRACEEWAMKRGECPIGGVKTTGFYTIAQSFCAWSGGKTFAVENAICTFADESTCLADDFYKGICQKGENK